FEKLSDQELDQVSGGVHGDTDENGDGGKSILMKALSGGCIECGNPSISHGWGWINGVAAGDRRYVVLCRCCKNRFYVDDDGKIVSSILIHDGYFRP
ncbi:MAG: bacteriocin, partial [Clostridia bacterium]|nr:bacteriocin [Clostridia bacterium]